MLDKISLFSIIIISLTPLVFAQEIQVPGDLPITSKPSDWIIVSIGILGGLTAAGLGIAKNHNKMKENEKILKAVTETNDTVVNNKVKDNLNGVLPTKLTFDSGKFARTIIVATRTSILLAAGSATVFTELNPITIIMIYAASIGMSSISKPGNK
jgi:hypothetical protein